MPVINRGLLAALSAPFFIAFSVIFIKKAGTHVPPLVIASLGSLISVPLLLLYHWGRRSPMPFLRLLKEQRGRFLQLLMCRTVFGQAFIVAGFAMTSVVKSVLLLRLEPLFVLFWSILYRHERPDARKFLMLAVLLSGTAMVVAPNSIGAPNMGDALIVLSLVFLSYSYRPTEQAVKAVGAPVVNISLSIGGGMILALVALSSRGATTFAMSLNDFLLIAGYSLVFFVIACSLYFYAFNTIKPWLIASILSLEVVFGVVLAVLLLHESVSAMQLVGCAVVIAATLALAAYNGEQEKSAGTAAGAEKWERGASNSKASVRTVAATDMADSLK